MDEDLYRAYAAATKALRRLGIASRGPGVIIALQEVDAVVSDCRGDPAVQAVVHLADAIRRCYRQGYASSPELTRAWRVASLSVTGPR
jgi:hypothetical protein